MTDVKDNAIGVGLSCSKLICEFLGGTIDIDKNSIKGTSVVIILPITIQHQAVSFSEIAQSLAKDEVIKNSEKQLISKDSADKSSIRRIQKQKKFRKTPTAKYKSAKDVIDQALLSLSEEEGDGDFSGINESKMLENSKNSNSVKKIPSMKLIRISSIMEEEKFENIEERKC